MPRVLLLSIALAGCAPPSVMLGASLGWTSGRVPDDGSAFVRTRSALFVRLGAELEPGARVRDPLATEPQTEGVPAQLATICTLEAACAWERAQVARADQHWRTP
jgi:hypothetical protein